jgi:ElaB/YqjD/DUF883 family membrane-anchored ribosome-binding protein
MATTSDLAPNRRKAAAAGTTSSVSDVVNEVERSAREERLEDQVSQLQSDLKGIASTLAKLTGDKVSEVRDLAKSEARHLQRQGQHVVEDVQVHASAMEQSLKETIREKPLTAVASAAGIGFILALLTRR